MIRKIFTVEKKQHTVKNNLIAKTDGDIIYLSPTYPGSTHDKKICDEENILFSKNVYMFVDLGFIGLTSGAVKIMIPFKSRKKQELNEEQKGFNKWLSSIRVKVEHVIGSVKINRKVKEKFRGRMYNREDTIMLVSCALHNLKVRLKNAA